MKRTWIHRGIAVSSVITLASLGASFASASCATNEPSAETSGGDDAAVIPETSPPAPGADAGAEAGCDASSSDCITEVVSCDRVAWCTAKTDVSVLYALAAVWGSSKSDVWAVGSGGTIIHYDGTTWKPTPSGVQNTFLGVWGSGPNDVYAVSSAQVIVHSTGFASGAATWKLVPTDNEPYNSPFLRAVWGSSATDVRVGGRAYDLDDPDSDDDTGDQFVRRTTADGGIAWRPLLGSDTVTSIWGSSADDVWMTADNSVYVSYERGMTLHGTPRDAGGKEAGPLDDRLAWTPVDSQSSLTLESVWGSSANDVWAVGGGGNIRHFVTGDIRWQEVVSPTKETLRSVWGSGPKDIWAVGDNGTIIHWDGTSFKASTAQFPIGIKPRLNGIWGSGPDDVWIVGDGVVLHYTGPKPGVTGGAK